MGFSNPYLTRTVQHGRQMVLPLELKSLAKDGSFAGYASVFHVTDSQGDVMEPGAFKACLRRRTEKFQLLWQHRWESPIGVVDAIFEDMHGLYIQGRLLMEVAQAREAHALLKAGVIRGLSIGYSVQRAERDTRSGVRHLQEVDLWEVSIVTLPANEAAQVTVVKAGTQAVCGLMAALAQAERALAPC